MATIEDAGVNHAGKISTARRLATVTGTRVQRRRDAMGRASRILARTKMRDGAAEAPAVRLEQARLGSV